MTLSGNSLEATPQFSVLSQKSDLELPNEVVWNSALLQEDEVIVYISAEGEKQIISSTPIDDDKPYKVILFDYSTSQ